MRNGSPNGLRFSISIKKLIAISLFFVISIILSNFLMQTNAYSLTNTYSSNLKMNVKNPIFQYKKALGAMKAGYNYTAVQHFQKAIILKPHFAKAWGRMGIALHRLGFPSLAIVSLKKALKYNPNLLWAKKHLKKYELEPGR